MRMLRSSMLRHFGTIAPRYRELRDVDERAVDRVSRELEILSQTAPRVLLLDVGAGTGRYTEAVLRDAAERGDLAFHGVAYDAVQEMLSSGSAHRALRTGSIDRTIGLAELLPFGAASFDAVLSFNAVHHFDLPAFLGEAARVLRPGGRFIVYTRTPEQNERTVWGRFFPHFAARETRLYSEATLRETFAEAREFESHEIVEMPWTIRASLQRLLDQARSRGYSTFWFYEPREFEEAVRAFEARVRAHFADASAVTAQNDHLLVLAMRR